MPANSAKSSGLITAAGNTLIYNMRTRLNGFIVLSDGTNLATVTLYDNNLGDTSGPVIAKVLANSSQPSSIQSFDNPVQVDNGISVNVTGTGAAVIVYYNA